MKSEENVADKFTREAPSLEVSISHFVYQKIWNKWGPFQWDIMASSANFLDIMTHMQVELIFLLSN